MSGTVPPPPPSPGGGPESRDGSEPGEAETRTGAPRTSPGASLPPSISPAGRPSHGSPSSPARTVHEPIPPAPGQQADMTAPLWTAQQPPAEHSGTTDGGTGASDWWGGQWSGSSQAPTQSFPPAQSFPAAQTYPSDQSYPADQSNPSAQSYPPPQSYAPAGQGYGQGHAQPYDQSYDSGYGQGQAPGSEQGYTQGYAQGQPQGYGGDYGAPPPSYADTPAPPPPGGGKKRRRLTPGWIAFIAVDVLLIVVAIIFAVQIFGSSPLRTDDADTGPGSKATSEATAPADEDKAAEAKDKPLSRFASPSRNITCSIFEDSVTCGIAELDQQPAPMEDCSGTTGYVVRIAGEDGAVSLPCVEGSDQPKPAAKKLKVLDYGESVTEGDFTCESGQSGMQCRHDPTGKGFSLARAGVGTF